VGTDTQRIVAAVQSLLDEPEAYKKMSHAGSPYGDGQASARILSVLRHDLTSQ
jgi:UDP-N-acetylglucosamine 2-epimerase